MLAFLTWLGKLALPLASLTPLGGPRVAWTLAALLGALIVIGGPAGTVWLNMHAKVAAAAATEKAACELKISQTESAFERTISDILSSVNEQGQQSENVADYCKRNPGLCRTEGGE